MVRRRLRQRQRPCSVIDVRSHPTPRLKHHNGTALTKPMVVKRPWLDEDVAEDLSLSPPPFTLPSPVSPALSDGCVPDVTRPFDLSLKPKKHDEYPTIIRPVVLTPPPGIALVAPKGERNSASPLGWHRSQYLTPPQAYAPLTLYPVPPAADFYGQLMTPSFVSANHPLTPRELSGKQSPPQKDAVVPSWSSGVSSSDEKEWSVAGSPVPETERRRTNNDVSRYQCSDCNKSYSTYSGLSKHKQFHCVTSAKKSFSCKYCEKVYISLGALKMHIRTHTLPCKCKLCGKAFSRPWLLQGHIRTHTGEKPFACPHCSRAFADRSNLRAHLQTHSDVKKYSCKSCSKTFSRMSLLLKHEDGGCAAAVGSHHL
ncbi:zinc finger protein SNAI2-like isoform X2 [Ornithodoros turicata]|uniref:zinc finger protein SNAI2-like isoform X2 n=1 Tax=Ornithodoros turicata TaxID=34597 RepID=UPI00313902FF